MLIVDAQVHIWEQGTASAHQMRKGSPFSLELLDREMDAAGVDCAVLAPPTWDPTGNGYSLDVARRHSDRFAVTGNIGWNAREDRPMVRNWLNQPGMVGIRLSYNSPDKLAHLAGGAADWIWEEAQAANIPVMILIPDGLEEVRDIVRRFPGLRLCVDHLAIPRGAKDAAAFAHLPELITLARHRNLSVKLGGLAAYSTVDDYPYPSLHNYVRQVFDAFGPERIFWASDLTRVSNDYREIVTMVSEGLDFLGADDRRLIMGEAVCNWLNWHPQGAALFSEPLRRAEGE